MTATGTDLEQRIAALESELGLLKYNFAKIIDWVESTTTLSETTAEAARDLASQFHKSLFDV